MQSRQEGDSLRDGNFPSPDNHTHILGSDVLGLVYDVRTTIKNSLVTAAKFHRTAYKQPWYSNPYGLEKLLSDLQYQQVDVVSVDFDIPHSITIFLGHLPAPKSRLTSGSDPEVHIVMHRPSYGSSDMLHYIPYSSYYRELCVTA